MSQVEATNICYQYSSKKLTLQILKFQTLLHLKRVVQFC